MGLALSAPELGGGLVTITAGVAVTFATYFLAAPTDTNSFGFSATVVDFDDHTINMTYTDTATMTQTVQCSMADANVNFPSTTGSLQCDVANTAIATGPVTLSLFDSFPQTLQLEIYVGQTTMTETDYTNTTTFVPSGTIYATTVTSTTFDATLTTTDTTTLTGPVTPFCSATSTSAPAACTDGPIFRTLLGCPVVADHMCNDLLTKPKHTAFPSSADVWPASALKGACRCYEKYLTEHNLGKRDEDEQHHLARRGDPHPHAPLTEYNASVTTVYNYTMTDTAYVIETEDATTFIDGGNTTVPADSTITIDDRTTASDCLPSPSAPPAKREPISTCANVELLTAYLWVEMAQPVRFCKYYLSEPRSHVPLVGVSPAGLTNACKSVMTKAGKTIPAKKTHVVPAVPKQACDGSHAANIRTNYNQVHQFCKYWTATRHRDLSPLGSLGTVEDLFAGCQCIL
ncbi:hypothetical protein ANO11243_092430 [Dothideomycetidae sp. 11243]|nr:hypothetical protein ANO11243_092430 [fungal sp. No.11243]